MTIGERIKDCRKSIGVSQETLSERCDLSPAAICQYETGKRCPDLRCFVKLTIAFSMSIDKFLEGVEL